MATTNTDNMSSPEAVVRSAICRVLLALINAPHVRDAMNAIEICDIAEAEARMLREKIEALTH